MRHFAHRNTAAQSNSYAASKILPIRRSGLSNTFAARFPDRPIKLAVALRRSRGNPKISNILNMFPLAQNEIIVLSDSDMCVDQNYVRDVVATLQQPEVGLVTCLYRGRAVGGIWSRLAAAAVDHHFLPSVLVGLRFGLAQPCFGSTIALRRETLKRIGGFESVADTLADDYAIGDAVRRLGLKIAIPPFTVDHTFSERTLSEVLAHELRWARHDSPCRSQGLRGFDRDPSAAFRNRRAAIEWLQRHRPDHPSNDPCLPRLRSDTS